LHIDYTHEVYIPKIPAIRLELETRLLPLFHRWQKSLEFQGRLCNLWTFDKNCKPFRYTVADGAGYVRIDIRFSPDSNNNNKEIPKITKVIRYAGLVRVYTRQWYYAKSI